MSTSTDDLLPGWKRLFKRYGRADARALKGVRMTGAELIAAERCRQVEQEGYTPEHDDDHGRTLVRAAEAYLTGQKLSWPWDQESFKPTTRVRDLTKAGALIAAEIDRLQRRG